MPGGEAMQAIGQRIEEARACLERLRAATHGDSPSLARLREDADRLTVLLDAVAAHAAAERQRLEDERLRIDDVLEAIYAVAALDFSRRAEVRADGPLDALALSVNMLAEELDEAQRRLVEAKANAEAATEAKSRFLAQMSHEIRTPLTAVLGFTDMLAAPTLGDSDRLNYAMIVRRNGEHLLSLIDDILDLSKIEAEKLQLETIECSPAMILSDLESLMRVRATERGLALDVRLETPIPATFRTDPTRLRQVLLNIVGNAVKFTEQGIVRVLVRYDNEASRLRFAVVDSGIGMSPEQLSKLFQPFEQADLSMTRRFGGSGLGLAISRYLVAALGGEIEAVSTLGLGSRFTISVPVAAWPGMPMVSELSAARRAVAAAPSPSAAFRGTVLLAEDGPDNQVLITTLLRQYGLTVAAAADGALALDRALRAWHGGTAYDLILMDMQMPVMDGYEATRRLRMAGYGGPIVAVTAHAMEGELERCVAAGCNGYVRKPIDRSQLLAVLGRYFPPGQKVGPDASQATTVAAPNDGSEPAPLVSTMASDPEMAEVVERFVNSLPERAHAIRDAARTEAPSLKRLVHQLKGAAGGYGFPAITDAAALVESMLEASADPTALEAHIDELVGLCTRARAAKP